MKRALVLLVFLPVLVAQTLHIEKGETRKGDLLVYKKDVVIDGRLLGNLMVFKGNAEIRGEVSKDVIVAFGELNLSSSAKVKGDVVVLGGKVHKEKGAEVGGEVIRLYLRAREELGWKGVSLLRNFTSFLLWLVFIILLLYIFPRPIQFTASYMGENLSITAGYGLFLLFLSAVLMVVFILLSAIIIGIPFLLLLVFLIIAAVLFGKVSFFLFLGRALLPGVGSPYLQAIVGLLLYSLLLFVPYLAVLVKFIGLIMSFGAVFLTRFGTKI